MDRRTFTTMDGKILFVVLLMSLIELGFSSANNQTVLSRQKRYLVFPTGSSFSVAVCMTIGVYGNPQYSMFRLSSAVQRFLVICR